MYRFKYMPVIAIFTLLAIAGWVLGVPSQVEAEPIPKILLNGSEVILTPNPEIIAQRTYVPVRFFEKLGAKVNWNQDTKQVIINWRTTSTSILPPAKQGEIQIILDGQVILIPANYGKPYINVQYRTMIPLKIVTEAIGGEVNWIKESNSIDIKAKTLLPTVSSNGGLSENQQSTNTIKPSDTSDIKITAASADNQLLKELATYRTNLKLMDGSVIRSEQLMNQDASTYSSDQLAVFKTYRDQLSKYQQNVTLPTGVTINSADLAIMGNSYLSADQLKKWIINETPRISANMTARGLQFKTIPDLADLYIKIGAEYGIRGDIAFCQAAKETGYWQFTGDVQPYQNNYCGLWATGSPLTGQESANGADPSYVCFVAGAHGATFASPAAGVEAHIQHLYAYATKNPLPSGKILIDPRYSLVNRGIAPSWLNLNARWAVPGTTYGQSIIYDYWLKAVNNK